MTGEEFLTCFCHKSRPRDKNALGSEFAEVKKAQSDKSLNNWTTKDGTNPENRLVCRTPVCSAAEGDDCDCNNERINRVPQCPIDPARFLSTRAARPVSSPARSSCSAVFLPHMYVALICSSHSGVNRQIVKSSVQTWNGNVERRNAVFHVLDQMLRSFLHPTLTLKAAFYDCVHWCTKFAKSFLESSR